MEFSIETVSYAKRKDRRILKSCLSVWFRDPKDLNLTEPRIGYPFNFNTWRNLSYRGTDIITLALKGDDWIIGHLSLKVNRHKHRGHIFHFIIDPAHRRQGWARRMLEDVESRARKLELTRLTLRVTAQNQPAIQLYRAFNYRTVGQTAQGSLMMEKTLT